MRVADTGKVPRLRRRSRQTVWSPETAGSSAVSEWSEHTVQGYRRFRCRACGKQCNERSDGLLNRTRYASDVIALMVFRRLRYKLSIRDLTT
jgi:putative transposase